ncbi:MAG: termination factor Rho, partial [Alistipes sp.]|nr:termination factor Rho [Alistipes sp.]
MFAGRSYSDTVVNLLIALAICLIVNFSYVLLFLVDRPSDDGFPRRPDESHDVELPGEGRLSLSVDGHGYIVYGEGGVDSVYITSGRAKRLGLVDGDMLRVEVQPVRSSTGAHLRFSRLVALNGEPFDYSTIFNRPKEGLLFALQILYFFALAYFMLAILSNMRHVGSVRRSLWCILLAAALYFVAPVAEWPSGRIVVLAGSKHLLDYNMILKCSFALVVTLLSGCLLITSEDAD